MRIGNPTWPSSKIATQAASQERVVLVTGAATVPIDHALELLGLEGTVLRFDTDIPNKYSNRLRLAQQEQFFANLHTLESFRIDWFLAVYVDQPSDDGRPDQRLNDWVQASLNQALALIQSVSLKAAMIMCPIVFPSAARIGRNQFTTPFGWKVRIITLRNTYHGGSIETDHEVLLLLRDDDADKFSLPMITSTPGAMNEIIDLDPNPQTFLWLSELSIKPAPEILERRDEHDQSSHTVKLVKLRSDAKPFDGWNTFCPSRPGPSIARPRPEEKFFSAPFALWLQPVPTTDPNNATATLEQQIKSLGPACRPISLNEILQLLGLEDETVSACRFIPESIVLTHARSTPGSHGLSALLRHIALSELHTEESDIPGIYSAVPQDTLSLIPLPTDDEWRQATLEDHDLSRILDAFKNQRELLARELDNNEYALVIKNDRIEVTDGIIYYFERSKASRLRQLRTKVVPASLRQVVIIACHSSPFAGHSGITRTLFRVQTRFWWPGLVRDVTDGVRSCMHCNLANATSHENQSLLNTLACDVPFDVIFLDIWSPGSMPDKYGTLKVLTFIDCMTGFAMATFINQGKVDARTIADAALTAFFGPVGLPRLIIVDADTIFAGEFKALFHILRIPVDPVSKENHKAVRNERFHRYLNKVQRINTADVGSLFQWKQGVLFAAYAWNAGPIDGTDIPRSLVAVGREFPFPIDLSNAIPRDGASEGQSALDHFESATPLLFKQRQLLSALNAERRQRHIDIRNEGKKQRAFDIGDIVIVRKQVKSNKSKGISAKLLFKTRGPYRVIDKITPSSYKLQKLPFLKGLGKPGIFCKENVARMEKIPSTLILHRKADGADTRFSLLHGELAGTPLQKYLGVLKAGSYQQALPDKSWAYETLQSMWTEDVDEDDDDPTSEDEEYRVDILDSDDDDDDEERLVTQPPFDPSPTTTATLPAATPMALPPPVQQNDTAPRSLKKLYRQVSNFRPSDNAMFFASYATNKDSLPHWRLGEVLLNETAPSIAKKSGIYQVRWWTQQHEDRINRSIVDSRFWPEVYRNNTDGTKRFSMKPDKVMALSKDASLIWKSEAFELAECIIVGPFFFSTLKVSESNEAKRRAVTEPNRIINKIWQILERRAPLFKVSVDNIREAPTTGPHTSERE